MGGDLWGVQDLACTAKGPRGLSSHVPTAAAEAPASHPKYMCSLVSASLGWIRAQLWGSYPPGGDKFRLPRERAAFLGQEGTLGPVGGE